jgi:hypothetical protein
MSTAWSRAFDILRRPATADTPPPGKTRGKPPAAPQWSALRAEVEAALDELAHERAEAEHVIAMAGEKRETLFMQPGSDDEIIGLGAAIDRANLTLERLDRLEPDMRRRLGEIKFHERGARWIEARDAAAAAAAQHVAAIEAYQNAIDAWRVTYNAVVAEFPTATEILPLMPGLIRGQTTFAAQIERLRTLEIQIAAPDPGLLTSLAHVIEYAQQTGCVPEGMPGDWVPEIERAISGETRIKCLVAILDSEGRTVAKGAKITLPYEKAAAHVRSGRAVYE